MKHDMTRVTFGALTFAALAFGTVLGGCDPVHSDSVDSLGPEDPNVRKGPTHRPGQPCLECHGGDGPASRPIFTAAGTIFHDHDTRVGVEGAHVTMRDAAGKTVTALTNSVGNFYLTQDQWDPAYPVTVGVCAEPCCTNACDATDINQPYKLHKTHIGRNGSCGGCHTDPEGVASPGHIFLVQGAAP
jgi:hypothetical protein